MSKKTRSGQPTKLLIIDMDFIFEFDQESRGKFFSQITGYSCYKAGLSSSKKTKKKVKNMRKKITTLRFLRKRMLMRLCISH
ncbi:hypothetical protein RchiOBHm_Chr2g0167521 [Rosa chinensis]|uniref:Uncharacterized protein n=1 Tax=Rosa chinensis TaxID=74649 RepID=A0A2P6S4C7_ROSCH|nr:hypothetical protein RchiOBHm_Chr2g0167521 [Rosa chinensis]